MIAYTWRLLENVYSVEVEWELRKCCEGRRQLNSRYQKTSPICPALRQEGLLYVDKTADIHRVAAKKDCYFPSRPRRLGKTLLADTIQSLFECRKKLVEELYIHGR